MHINLNVKASNITVIRIYRTFVQKKIYIYIYIERERERERELKPINVIGDCPLCHSLNL